MKLGLTWIINKSNKWFSIWSWKLAFELESIQNSNTNMNLSSKELGPDKGIDSKCTLHVIHKCGHKGYVVLASLFWYKMHTTWLHMESMDKEHLTFVTMHLLLLKVVFAQVFHSVQNTTRKISAPNKLYPF